MANSSKLPDGGYLPTYGSSLLLDGFDFTEEYGEGPESARKDPDPDLPRSQNGLSSLPDGFLDGHTAGGDPEFLDTLVETGDEAGLGDLSSLVKNASQVIDLQWLEEAEQDPDRLPKQPNESVLQGVVDAWGVESRTNGLGLVPNKQFPPPVKSRVTLLPGDQYRGLVASAMRRSAFRESFDNIVQDTARQVDLSNISVDVKLQHLASAIRNIRAEHGLVGNVYLRDTAFPGLLTGKWDSEIRKKCSGARYWLTSKNSKLSAYQNYLGKAVVTAIPWSEALSHYRSILVASGKKLATGNPREVLRLAFLASDPIPTKSGGVSVTATVDTISAKDAWDIFSSAPLPKQAVVVQKDTSMQKAVDQVGRWVSSGLLTEGDSKVILAKAKGADSILRVASARILASGKSPDYSGQGVGVQPMVPVTTQDGNWARGQEKLLSESSLRKAREIVLGFVKSGSLSQRDADTLLSKGLSAKDLVRFASARAADTTKPVVMPRVEERAYQGAEYKANRQGSDTKETQDWAKVQEATLEKVALEKARSSVLGLVTVGSLSPKDAASLFSSNLSPVEMVKAAEMRAQDPYKPVTLPTVAKGQYLDTKYTAHVAQSMAPRDDNPLEVRRLLRWASVQMTEGFAGQDLDHLLQSRFSSGLLKASEAPLVQLRLKHEGLAGHLYVDASAYATPAGTTGCDTGALTHRANAIPSVLQMDRCGSCSANVDGSCQKYRKLLVSGPPVPDPVRYQKEAIRLANSGDAERTASLFTPSYSAEEFDLQNDGLDQFDYDTLPSNEEVSDVLFDGFVIPSEEE